MFRTFLFSATATFSMILTTAAFGSGYVTPSVPEGEECVALSEEELEGVSIGFPECFVEAWNEIILDENGFIFRYTVSGETFIGEISAPTEGYIGFGIGTMTNSDMIILSEVDGVFGLNDFYTSLLPTPRLDEKNGGASDLTSAEFFLQEETGTSRMRFSRPLITGDSRDRDLIPSETVRLIFAYGDSKSLNYHGLGKRTSLDIQL